MSGNQVHPDGDITSEQQGAVLLIGLNRPEKINALTGRMMRQLSEAYAEYDHNDQCRCAVLYGHGRAFCGGADLS
jgi:enoyl-CoA hydratase/carnithine racemase